ncbi:hypothetical protein [Stakelama saccharophila]|uniref:Uncharacterized protein n=1 Tax=Stakelama saccharophila TaxID=3075605 RepID=A0ABZ0BA80_9SPHN|nr:hypothetical protein [Stakelama sp. W311]WNO53768.1 hypothetical protein RPR59_00425 [Stakelama sp. W311]
MRFLRFFSPLHAYRDLRRYLLTRKRHELWFMLASLVVTMTVVTVFLIDAPPPAPPPAPEIIYVESWPLNRTDEQIAAAAKVAKAKRAAREAELARLRAARREQFREVDNSLDSWGL